MTQITSYPDWDLQQFIWDQADRLMAVNNKVGIHHYVYDHTGTRLMKGTYTDPSVSQNGETILDGTVSPQLYTIYVSPHMVCTFYANG